MKRRQDTWITFADVKKGREEEEGEVEGMGVRIKEEITDTPAEDFVIVPQVKWSRNNLETNRQNNIKGGELFLTFRWEYLAGFSIRRNFCLLADFCEVNRDGTVPTGAKFRKSDMLKVLSSVAELKYFFRLRLRPYEAANPNCGSLW